MIKIPYGWLLGNYKKFPNSIQYILGSCLKPFPRSFLLGPGFNEKLRFLMDSEKWPSEDLMKYTRKAYLYFFLNPRRFIVALSNTIKHEDSRTFVQGLQMFKRIVTKNILESRDNLNHK